MGPVAVMGCVGLLLSDMYCVENVLDIFSQADWVGRFGGTCGFGGELSGVVWSIPWVWSWVNGVRYARGFGGVFGD